MRARYYDPSTGRFMSEDPIGFAGGDYNLYRYVRNVPTNSTDPSGLDSFYNINGPHVSVVITNPNMPGNTVTVDFNPSSGDTSQIMLGKTVQGRVDINPGTPTDGINLGNRESSPEQDSKMLRDAINQQQDPEDYNLYRNNCINFSLGLR